MDWTTYVYIAAAVATLILFAVWLLAKVHRHKPVDPVTPQQLEEKLAPLHQEMARLAEYLDGLPETKDEKKQKQN